MFLIHWDMYKVTLDEWNLQKFDKFPSVINPWWYVVNKLSDAYTAPKLVAFDIDNKWYIYSAKSLSERNIYYMMDLPTQFSVKFESKLKDFHNICSDAPDKATSI